MPSNLTVCTAFFLRSRRSKKWWGSRWVHIVPKKQRAKEREREAKKKSFSMLFMLLLLLGLSLQDLLPFNEWITKREVNEEKARAKDTSRAHATQWVRQKKWTKRAGNLEREREGKRGGKKRITNLWCVSFIINCSSSYMNSYLIWAERSWRRRRSRKCAQKRPKNDLLLSPTRAQNAYIFTWLFNGQRADNQWL